MSAHGKDAHKRAARMLGYVLTLDEVNAWWGFSAVLEAHLTTQERAAIALMSLKALPADDGLAIARAAFPAQHIPDPPLLGCLDQAAFWADYATVEELDAYCLSSFNAMTGTRQAAFLDFVQRREAA
ncbi:MAG: hypothetical protein AAF340_16355 [Pseudomonadota bacterium]